MFVWPPAFLSEPGSARYSSRPLLTIVWSNYQTLYNDFFEVYITKKVTLSPNVQTVLWPVTTQWYRKWLSQSNFQVALPTAIFGLLAPIAIMRLYFVFALVSISSWQQRFPVSIPGFDYTCWLHGIPGFDYTMLEPCTYWAAQELNNNNFPVIFVYIGFWIVVRS